MYYKNVLKNKKVDINLSVSVQMLLTLKTILNFIKYVHGSNSVSMHSL